MPSVAIKTRHERKARKTHASKKNIGIVNDDSIKNVNYFYEINVNGNKKSIEEQINAVLKNCKIVLNKEEEVKIKIFREKNYCNLEMPDFNIYGAGEDFKEAAVNLTDTVAYLYKRLLKSGKNITPYYSSILNNLKRKISFA